jgi:hypothetical protein
MVGLLNVVKKLVSCFVCFYDNQISPEIHEHETTPGNAYSNVQMLSSQVSFLAPKNLALWSFLSLGLKCSLPLSKPLIYKKTSYLISFVVDEDDKKTIMFQNLQEYVFCIVEHQFGNPRLSQLSDLHPQHPSALYISFSELYIHRVKVSPGPNPRGSLSKIGYILSPKHEPALSSFGWILVSTGFVSLKFDEAI